MAKTKPMGTGQVEVALEHRYAGDAWALFFEVRNGTGYSRRTRSADALAMSLWPSRGLELHGHEIKASRSDWLSELKKPDKAEEICRFCDRWWVVVGDAEIVKDGELPPTWGLLVPQGKKLRVKVDAPKLEPEPVTRLFLASLMRSISNYKPAEDVLEAKLKRSYERGRERGKEERDTDAKVAEVGRALADQALATEQAAMAAFKKASGLCFNLWNAGEIGTKVHKYMRAKDCMDEAITTANRMADELFARSTIMRSAAEDLARLGADSTDGTAQTDGADVGE